jgi:hypothetical protein
MLACGEWCPGQPRADRNNTPTGVLRADSSSIRSAPPLAAAPPRSTAPASRPHGRPERSASLRCDGSARSAIAASQASATSSAKASGSPGTFPPERAGKATGSPGTVPTWTRIARARAPVSRSTGLEAAGRPPTLASVGRPNPGSRRSSPPRPANGTRSRSSRPRGGPKPAEPGNARPSPGRPNAARASRLSSRPSGSYAREPKRPA